jgi:hypothetical protein
MKAGDKVVFSSAHWIGEASERMKTVLTIIEIQPAESMPAARVSVRSGSGEIVHGLPAGQLELIEQDSASDPQASRTAQ